MASLQMCEYISKKENIYFPAHKGNDIQKWHLYFQNEFIL